MNYYERCNVCVAHVTKNWHRIFIYRRQRNFTQVTGGSKEKLRRRPTKTKNNNNAKHHQHENDKNTKGQEGDTTKTTKSQQYIKEMGGGDIPVI